MVIIGNFKVSKGYKIWKKAFLENEKMRKEYGIKVLAYGQNAMNSNHIYTVIDVPSLETMQKLMQDPEMIKLRENAGVISESQEMIQLKE